jgi:transposase
MRAFIKKLRFFEYGIRNHADYPVGTSDLEGVNTKIKLIKRRAYGYHDSDYFALTRIFHGYSIMVGRDAGSTNFVSKPFESDTFAANSADGPLSPIPKTGFSGIIAIP